MRFTGGPSVGRSGAEEPDEAPGLRVGERGAALGGEQHDGVAVEDRQLAPRVGAGGAVGDQGARGGPADARRRAGRSRRWRCGRRSRAGCSPGRRRTRGPSRRRRTVPGPRSPARRGACSRPRGRGSVPASPHAGRSRRAPRSARPPRAGGPGRGCRCRRSPPRRHRGRPSSASRRRAPGGRERAPGQRARRGAGLGHRARPRGRPRTLDGFGVGVAVGRSLVVGVAAAVDRAGAGAASGLPLQPVTASRRPPGSSRTSAAAAPESPAQSKGVAPVSRVLPCTCHRVVRLSGAAGPPPSGRRSARGSRAGWRGCSARSRRRPSPQAGPSVSATPACSRKNSAGWSPRPSARQSSQAR